MLLLVIRTFAYNTSKQETTRFSLFQLTFARNPTLLLDTTLLEADNQMDSSKLRKKTLMIRAIAADNIHTKQDTDKGIYDAKPREGKFVKGDWWFGSYVVIKKISDVNYEVRQEKARKHK